MDFNYHELIGDLLEQDPVLAAYLLELQALGEPFYGVNEILEDEDLRPF